MDSISESSQDQNMLNRRPSICFVAPNAYPVIAGDERIEFIGGAELQQVIVAKGLADRGYRVSMICLDFGQQDGAKIDGVTVIRAFKPDEGVSVLRYVWPRLTSIWACLKRAEAQIYYQRTAGMLTGVVAEFCRRHDRKSVFAAAGNPDLELNTSRIRFARDRWIYQYGLRRVDRILVQNDEQGRLCKANFGRTSTLIPNCFLAAPRRQVQSACDVLWVSTVRNLKRPNLFLDLAETLPNYRFRMIGGPDGRDTRLFDTVKSRARTIPNIEFLGFVPYAKVGQHFDETSVFVNTSESEGFPNSFLQAWARGVPSVAFVDSGVSADGVGIGCQVNSIVEMADCVAKWLADDVVRRQEGTRCREYVERIHSPARVLDLYEQVIMNLAEESR